MTTIETIIQPEEKQPSQTERNDEKISVGKQTKKRATKKTPPLTLFEHLVRIGSTHEKIGAKPETVFGKAKEHVGFVCEKLELTPLQSVLLSDLLCASDGDSVCIRSLAELMKCKPIEVCAYMEEFEALELKNLIEIDADSRRSFRSGISFKIPFATLCSLQKGEAPENPWIEKLTPQGFMEQISKLCESRKTDKENYTRVIRNFGVLLEHNRHIELVKTLRSYELCRENELLLMRFCQSFTVYDEEDMDVSDLENFFQHQSNYIRARFDLRTGKHPFQEMQLIENVHRGGFAQRDHYMLTEKAKDALLGEYEGLLSAKTIKGMLDSGSIPEKPLFYPEKTSKSVQELSNLLHEKSWRQVRENLTEKGMRTGFACLFYGGPGTGKTETAKQIARATGRAIVQVDISETKSCWFGESEKRIKAIFSRYRAAVKNSEVTPILLLNEADAVISKRQDLGETRNGPAQTENAIQNIILQEMEELDGILIATTNLTQNMDKAFERRFLYKIEFETPTLDARRRIWRAMMPDLSEFDADVLAERFDFSGGQIENISRRRTVASVLHETSPDLDELVAYCEEEQSGNERSRRIGFVV